MKPLFLMAIRNVFRNKRRTIITEAAIIFGATTIILVGGIFEHMVISLREQAIRPRLGHLQIHAAGFSEKAGVNPLQYVIGDTERVIKVIETERHVETITKRISFEGIISTGETTTNFIATAVEPEKESLVGTYFKIVEGAKLSDRYEGGLVGKELAEGLHAHVGDVLTLLANTTGGSINAAEIMVEGIFQTGDSEYDKRAVIINLKNAQDLLSVPGALSIVVFLDETENTDMVAYHLKDKFKDKNIGCEIVPWQKQAIFYQQVAKMFNGLFGIIKFVIAVVIILGIANTMIMSVFERTQEIGTMMAMGTFRSEVWMLFLFEGLVLGLIGGALGIGVGAGITKLVALIGVTIPPPPGQNEAFVVRPMILQSSIIFAFVSLVITSFIAAMYPAYRASMLKPIDAIQHV